MSKQSDARRIASGLTRTITTSNGKVVAEVTCPTEHDARRVLAAFGREGWKTSIQGDVIRAEYQL